MDGAAPPEHRIRCLPPATKSGGDEVLWFELDGARRGVSLRIARWSQQLVANLPERSLDLLEIAALVYAADASVSRGGVALKQMGRQWHRRFVLEVPVRDLAFWETEGIQQALAELLLFLSGDHFEFVFSARSHPDAERSRFFRFEDEPSRHPDRVLMFSGGLDSFAGALEEIIRHKHSVALISHFSSTKIARVQRDLQQVLSDRLGAGMVRHFPVQVQMAGGRVVEGTHRSRSFLFAVLGAITAAVLGLDRVSFHENGVVSLNLPPVGNVLGTRATRTTHPRFLAQMTDLLGKVFDRSMRVDNPFFWHTKAEVLETIERLGMADRIRDTRSCADVHNQTKQYFHCGRCSQCIDRRFAVLATGLADQDPEEAYRVDLMTGARERVEDREIALSYVRNAEAYGHLTRDLLEQHFPAVLDAVNDLEDTAPAAVNRITGLLRRHGATVSKVMQETLERQPADSFPTDSLPRLYGDALRQIHFDTSPVSTTEEKDEKPVIFRIDSKRRIVMIGDIVEIRGKAMVRLLTELARVHLAGAGQGLDPFDYPAANAWTLTEPLGLETDEAVRQSVNRCRNDLAKRFESAGLDPDLGRSLIENIPGLGYRLAPDRVEIRMAPATR